MSYPVLPSAIPACALRADWSMRPIDPLRRTEMDDGVFSVERRLSRLGGIQTLVWEMTGPAFDLLVSFWADDLDAGARWFSAPVVEGSRRRMQLMRFSASPPWQGTMPAGGIFRFAFEAELREIPRLDPAERMATEVWLMDEPGVTALCDQLSAIADAVTEVPPWT